MTAWLLDTLLYTGLLIALVLVLRRPVGRWFGPQLAYALWALPLLRLLLPPVVLPASLAPAQPPAPAPDPASLVDTAASLAAEPAGDWIAAAPAAPVEAAPLQPLAPAWEWSDLGAVALSVWLGVALAFLAWRVVTYKRMRRELLAEGRTVGEIGTIRLVETPALAAPVAFGVRDKVIALPPLFMAQPDLTARDLAIAHELAHHRGHDLLANYAAQVLLALHWFNPLAWLGWRAMRRDQEAACDARVVAGRKREERALYAALIADIAAGPRLALAAPMACPVLGDKSIIHRLRSLSMSDTTPSRRRLGRGLIAAAALALPATASISYAAASAQVPEAPPAPELAPAPAAPPAPPEAPELREGEVRTFVLRRERGDGEPVVREFTLRGPGPAPDAPRPPRAPQFRWQGDPQDPDFQREMDEFQSEMEEFQREMQEWSEEHGEEWGRWSKQFGEQFARQAEGRRQAWANAERFKPEVVQSCDPNEARVTEDGRPRVVICQRDIRRIARSSLRGARASIAANPEISEEVRRQVLEDLDQEIARIEREEE